MKQKFHDLKIFPPTVDYVASEEEGAAGIGQWEHWAAF